MKVGQLFEGPRVDRGSPRKAKTTQTMQLISDLARHSDLVEQIVDVHAVHNGTVALVRTTDGQAYEIKVVPSYYGDYFQDKRGIE